MQNRNISSIIRQLSSDRRQETYSLLCTVVSVDEAERTCVCRPQDSTKADISNVRLQSVFNSEKGLFIIPVVESLVLVSFLEGPDQAFIAMFSEIESILIDTELVQFNGGDNGGLINIVDLVTKMNTMESAINDILIALIAGTPVVGDGGANYKASVTLLLPDSIVNTVRGDLEDEKITH